MTIYSRNRNSTQTMSINVEDTQTLAKYYEKNVDDRYCDTEFEGRESLNTKIRFYVGDIVQFNVDALVCPVQTDLILAPYGIHKQVLQKGGPLYQEKCQQISHCEPGESFVTKGFNLNAKYVIHTPGLPPNTRCVYETKMEVLKDSYLSCLANVCKNEDIQSVAFPCLGCGGGGIELTDAISIALTTIREWLETGDNISQIDCIILVIYNDIQRTEYIKHLTRVFPCGKDIAGIDLEKLESVLQSELNKLEPKEAVATSILCFHHKKQAQKEVNRHFHTLVNTVHKKIAAQTEPVERYNTCATFKVYADHRHHGIILYQGLKSHTVEVKVVCYSPNVNDVCNSLCEGIHKIIKNYLSEYLENSSTFKTFLRCELSNFGDKKNYISTKELYECLQKNTTYPCKHRTTGIHLVYPDKLLKYWTFPVESTNGLRQPVENDETANPVGQTGIQTSWNPLRPDSLTGSMQIDKTDKPSEMLYPAEIAETPQSYQPLSSTLFTDDSNESLTQLKQTNISSNIHREHSSASKSQMSSKGPKRTSVNHTQNHLSDVRGQQNDLSDVVNNRIEVHEAALHSWQRQQSSSLPTDQRPHPNLRQSNSCPSVCGRARTNRKSGQHDDRAPVHNVTYNTSQLDFDSTEACGQAIDSCVSDIETFYQRSTEELNDKTLLKIARLIGNKEDQLGIELDLPYPSIQRIKSEYSCDAVMQAFHILRAWKIQQHGNACMETIRAAMASCGIDTSRLQE